MSQAWKNFIREPLVAFFALGGGIFLLAHVMTSEPVPLDRRIVIDSSLESRLISINEAQYGVAPTAAQLQKLIDGYISDEILYRQALALGLNRNDEIIRRRLIQKMLFLQQDMAAASQPEKNDLRAYYAAHPDLFVTAAAVTFEQLFFSDSRGGANAARVRAEHARRMQERGGDVYPFAVPQEAVTREQAIATFGATPVVNALFDTPVGEWSAPVRSAYGWHLVRVRDRVDSSRLPFDLVEDQVRAAYLTERTHAAEQRALDVLRSRFEVVRAVGAQPSAS